MKTVATTAFGIASVAGLSVAAMSIASHVVAKPEHATLRSNSKPDLWTVEPLRIDRAKEHYVRLPAALSTYARAERQRATTAPVVTVEVRSPSSSAPRVSEGSGSVAHQAWCGARYKTYDRETDTYRTYDGERRACRTPNAQTVPQAAGDSGSKQDQKQWCSKTYASYRASDNTYQPFAGGRLPCVDLDQRAREVAAMR